MPLVKSPKPKLLPPPQKPRDVLVSLPTSKLPDNVPLDAEVVKACLWHAKGNIHLAAKLARVSSARMGAYLSNTPGMQEERQRAAELLVDKAETVVSEALDGDEGLDTAKWLLQNAGKARGYGKDAPAPGFAFGVPTTGSGQIAIRWEVDE